MPDIVADFLGRYPKVNVVAHATDQCVDIVGANYDVAIRAHSEPLANSTLVPRMLAPAPWLLFAGAAYLDAEGPLETPRELTKRPSLFMMRTGVKPIWRIRRSTRRGEEVVLPLKPRLLMDDMLSLKQAAVAGLGVVALPGYVCRDDVKSGALQRVLPDWIAGDSTLTALFCTGKACCRQSALSLSIWRPNSQSRCSSKSSDFYPLVEAFSLDRCIV
jgi:DNA-binding transcriptional LysR family regulator